MQIIFLTFCGTLAKYNCTSDNQKEYCRMNNLKDFDITLFETDCLDLDADFGDANNINFTLLEDYKNYFGSDNWDEDLKYHYFANRYTVDKPEFKYYEECIEDCDRCDSFINKVKNDFLNILIQLQFGTEEIENYLISSVRDSDDQVKLCAKSDEIYLDSNDKNDPIEIEENPSVHNDGFLGAKRKNRYLTLREIIDLKYKNIEIMEEEIEIDSYFENKTEKISDSSDLTMKKRDNSESYYENPKIKKILNRNYHAIPSSFLESEITDRESSQKKLKEEIYKTREWGHSNLYRVFQGFNRKKQARPNI